MLESLSLNCILSHWYCLYSSDYQVFEVRTEKSIFYVNIFLKNILKIIPKENNVPVKLTFNFINKKSSKFDLTGFKIRKL